MEVTTAAGRMTSYIFAGRAAVAFSRESADPARTILTMRCASLRHDGEPCYATATWGRLYCPAHDPAVRRRSTGFPPSTRERALELYQQVGPAEAARQLGIKSGTIRSWASRAGVSSPHVAYEWGRDVTTWPATVAAQQFAAMRRSKRRLAEVDQRLAALGLRF
ncbi:hypothetical protein BH18ACT15_BH18ACT15_14320 [soil metagenome]